MDPVDYASQGLTRSSNEQVHVWFDGPEFQWLKQTSMQESQDYDPEVTWRHYRKIGIFDLWDDDSLYTKGQEDPYLKDKASTIRLQN